MSRRVVEAKTVEENTDMVAYRQPRTFTPEEYLELERKSHYKSEYLDGQIYAMSGGSPEHSMITVNVSREVSLGLKGKPCMTFSNDTKVRTGTANLFSYPDLTVVCGEPRYHDAKRDVLLNPTLIIEVLSSSTEGYDRGEKFMDYQCISSLQTYVLIAQHQARIEQFVRQSNNDWLLSNVTGRDQNLYVASIDCTLALSEIYDRIAFPAVPDMVS